MARDPVAESEEVEQETVDLLLAQLERLYDQQFETIDALDAKVGQLLGVASLANALIGSALAVLVQVQELTSRLAGSLVLTAFFVGVVWYAATVYFLIRASRLQAYYVPLRIDVDHIEDEYLNLTRSETQEQLLSNYIEVMQINYATMTNKGAWVQRSLYSLGLDIVYLLATIAGASAVVLR